MCETTHLYLSLMVVVRTDIYLSIELQPSIYVSRYYQRILQETNLSRFTDPEDGHFMERAWMSIFFLCWRPWCPYLFARG